MAQDPQKASLRERPSGTGAGLRVYTIYGFVPVGRLTKTERRELYGRPEGAWIELARLSATSKSAAVAANEPGCLLYTLSKGDDPLTYVFMERYKDDDALKNHRGTDHFRTLGREMGAFMDGPPSVLRMQELG